MDFQFCPHCGKELPRQMQDSSFMSLRSPPPPPAQPATYDQTAYWRSLHTRSEPGAPPPNTRTLVEELVRRAPPGPSSTRASIIHMLLDRPVTPSGGTLLQSVASEGRLGLSGTPEHLALAGYVLKDGRVRQVEGVPIGRGFVALEYWGGARQHQRWHLAHPVVVNPSRHGDPYFMDERCLAVGATWRDLDRFAEAMTSLLETFRTGFDGEPVGIPLVVDVYWQGTLPSRA